MTPSQCESTFSNPFPGFQSQGCNAIDNSSVSSSRECATVITDSKQWSPNDVTLNLNVPSTPTTPPSAPHVRLPGSHLSESEEERNQPTHTSLCDITIPSPLLYHRKSREDLFGLCEDDYPLSNNDFALLCGQDPPDPDFASFRLESLSQLPGDLNKSRSFQASKLIGDGDEVSPCHDASFYQRTRTYLGSPTERSEGCTKSAPSIPQHPIVATTNRLGKRQTDIYPGEFALTPPAKLPSSVSATARRFSNPPDGHNSSAWHVTSEYSSPEYKTEGSANTDLVLPSPVHTSSSAGLHIPTATLIESPSPPRLSTSYESISKSLPGPATDSLSSTQSLSMVEAFPNIKIIEIKACPTSGCTTLLLVTPSLTRKWNAIGTTLGNIAQDLGLGIVHEEGCEFGAGEGVKHVRVEGDEEDAGSEDDWVGEGEGAEFWV